MIRNTWLLALSLLPTDAPEGAWLGATGVTRGLSGGLGLMVFLGGAFGFMFAIEKTRNSAAGVPVLLAFTFFMGLMLSRPQSAGAGPERHRAHHDGVGGTAEVFSVRQPASPASSARPFRPGQMAVSWAHWCSWWGHPSSVFVGSSVGMMVISTLVIGIFSLYMPV